MKILLFNENDMTAPISLPEAKELHVWVFPIYMHSLLAADMNALPDCERKRAAAFSYENDRLRYLVSRSLLRRLLSAYLHRPSDSFFFEKGKHGKPFLSDKSIFFNLSHSGDYIALAFCKDSPVGIDIEHVRPKIRMKSLVNRFFHREEARIFSTLPEQEKVNFLFRRWTVREAFLKGIGSGLSLPSDSFYVELLEKSSDTSSDMFSITKSQKDYSSWRISSIPAPVDYYLSVAYQIY